MLRLLNNKTVLEYYSEDMVNFIKTGNLSKDYIFNEKIGFTGDGISEIYIYFGIFLHQNFNTDNQNDTVLGWLITNAFETDYEIYEQMFSKIPKERLTKILNLWIKNLLDDVEFMEGEVNPDHISTTLQLYFDLWQRTN